jgi:hypothetical protein
MAIDALQLTAALTRIQQYPALTIGLAATLWIFIFFTNGVWWELWIAP